MIKNSNIDGGGAFDFGRTSADYAKYRDIYPDEFYRYLIDQGICTMDQRVLDIGTGTGVLPRNMYRYGARFCGVDIAENQIVEARRLALQSGMDIEFTVSPVEELDFTSGSFDCVTACQCFTYFDHDIIAPKIADMLNENGRFAVLYMAWLPYEDEIAGKSEELVLKYSPNWTGCGETRHLIDIPSVYDDYFSVESSEMYDLYVPFTRESWNGRMRSCRGVGASLTKDKLAAFDAEHTALLKEIAPENFDVLHYVAVTVLKKKLVLQ